MSPSRSHCATPLMIDALIVVFILQAAARSSGLLSSLSLRTPREMKHAEVLVFP